MAATLRLEGVTRRFAPGVGIGPLSLTVPAGALWVIVGPSGCGKSTLLRLIAGLEQPTSGQIYIGDTCVNGLSGRDRDVAMVFQNYALYPHMTVAENLGFGLKMRGVDPATRQQRILQVAKLLGIESLLQRKPRQLSGGQQQRVALGRALARSPQVFLLDEPLSNLDAQLREQTRAELKQLHQQLGITTLYVTHDQVEAMTLGDRIVVLDRGQIQQIGTPADLYDKPANTMVARFLGTPPMNLLPARWDGSRLWLAQQPLPCPDTPHWPLKSEQPLTVGIRPEHLSISEKGLGAIATLVESLGREAIVRCRLMDSSQELLWLAPNHQIPQMGDPLQLQARHLYLFDPTSGVALNFEPS
ncbi:ATP-binding cassette domain-containing protein [Thermosynechococcus sp. PP42]|uniref:ABC transporter ATP-binding protein n=1 Tax=Thermosynechococcus sp. PP42 TaxID=3074083 RepID=UPI0028641FE3|nr:ATP-binding cassette domain-containing protein [Thermosynechococcus sp. PP42]MDR5640000.1 ATP-binding cassette domain-containing protein [Thermosynechococcus sp. PP42]